MSRQTKTQKTPVSVKVRYLPLIGYSLKLLPRISIVAVFALITEQIMREVCVIDTAGDSAVVTTETGADDMIVVDPYDRCPCTGAVAILTYVGGQNMRSIFSRSDRTIVATEAGSDNLSVVDPRNRCPRAGAVTILAFVGSQNMSSVLSRGDRPVVATEAGSYDLVVVDPYNRCPCTGAVTILAYIGRQNVGSILTGSN